MRTTAPILDDRDADRIVAALMTRIPAWTPGWTPRPGSADDAIVRIFGRYAQALVERLNTSPDKNKLAFLDMLGVSLLPARPARAPLVFTPRPHVGDSRVPVRTRAGATVEGRADPVVFETEETIALAGARLAEIVTLWPARDLAADHSAELSTGQPVTFFDSMIQTPHEIYLAHDVHLALAGHAIVELQMELITPGSEPLDIAWEYWDGKVWRGFKPFPGGGASETDSLDATHGLTRSGTVRLIAECAETKPTVIHGVSSHWIRGRAASPLPPASRRAWPQVDRIGISTLIANESRRLVLLGVSSDAAGVVTLKFENWAEPDLSRGAAAATLTGPDGAATLLINKSELQWTGLTASGQFQLDVVLPGFAPFRHVFAFSPGRGIHLSLDRVPAGLGADKAFADIERLDLTKTFLPFGPRPEAGSSFYLASDEAFSKPGAQVSLHAEKADTPIDKAFGGTEVSPPEFLVETWNGERWLAIPGPSTTDVRNFILHGYDLNFTMPSTLASTKVNNDAGRWLRIRIVSGGFTLIRSLGANVSVLDYHPPAFKEFRIGYSYRSPRAEPQACLTYSDFQWDDRTNEASWRGTGFAPFGSVSDATPALYLGFDGPLPADRIGIYFDLDPAAENETAPVLRWEGRIGDVWLPLAVRDETENLSQPGIVSVLWPGAFADAPAAVIRAAGTLVQLADSRASIGFPPGVRVVLAQDGAVEMATVAAFAGPDLTLEAPLSRDFSRATIARAVLPRFGTPRTWIRARLAEDGNPVMPLVRRIWPNAVWASQTDTVENETIGSGNGDINLVTFLARTPVLDDEVIEVRELDGPRAAVELPILTDEITRAGGSTDDIRTTLDRRTGAVTEVWVRWRPRPNLFFSGPEDRHYVIERSRGRINWGDNINGRAVLAGAGNIRAQRYRWGGGSVGNLPAGAIKQLMSGVLALSVTNPRASDGGADGEAAEAVLTRGPLTLRNRRQAISADDYEALAREASPAVAIARALPTTDASLLPATGWVRLIIVPHGSDARPQPSLELRREVHDFLASRMPAGVVGRLSIVGPNYLPVGVAATLAPRILDEAGPVYDRATSALEAFFHPVNGGPEGSGWPFGRDVYLSDVAILLESLPGVDYVTTLELLLDGVPAGDRIDVPGDRILVAGPIRIMLTESEG